MITNDYIVKASKILLTMTDEKIAKKIVEHFLENHNFRNNQENFNELLNTGLSGAFIWESTPEGYSFWANLYYFRKFYNNEVFKSFMINNYIINEPNFIEIEFFI